MSKVVAEVVRLRLVEAKANAGENPGGTTLGGTDNAVKLAMLPGQFYGVEKRHIVPTMEGFDNSDSGKFKFRRKLVLVHCE